ncbi:MAG: DUF2064 domain-containing protein [bacterium]
MTKTTMTDNCVILFLTAPVQDKISRDMKEAFGPERACHIYTDMVREIFASLKLLKNVYTVLVYERTSKYPDLLWLDQEDPGFMEPQAKTEEARVTDAVKWAFSAGAKKVAVLSAQSPGVPLDWIENAFPLVNDRSVAVGADQDGGLYFFALSSAAGTELLEGWPWSGRKACEEIAEKAKKLRFTVNSMPEFYRVKNEQTLQQWTDNREKITYPSPASSRLAEKPAE